jgi:cytoskeletal protein CcmA (bactofilin family)
LRDQSELDTMLFKRRIRDSSAGPTTYIAASTKIVGTITGQGPYVFCGTVEGDCDINGPLTLAPGAIWRGTLKASDLVVAGTVEGDVVARQRVEIAGTARVTGSLSGNSIAVAEGAVIEGDIKVTNGEQAVTFHEKRIPEEA